MKKSLLISQSLISQLSDSARKLLIIKKKKRNGSIESKYKKTNKSFNEPKSWTQGKKIKTKRKKGKNVPAQFNIAHQLQPRLFV